MTPIEMAILLGAVGIVLLVAELMLPTHGLLGVIGCLAILAGIGACFAVDVWLGTGLLIGTLVAAPFICAWLVRIWPRMPVGRRILLPAPVDRPLPPPVQPGVTGVTISELRPVGVCEFAGQRMEAICDQGELSPGTKVRVVNVVNRRPTVRAMDQNV